MRRDFGSLIPDLIDQPLNGKTRMQLMAASVMAIYTWEPRVDLKPSLQQAEEASGLYADIELSRRDGPTAGQTSKLQIALKG
jgi:phage baseplate assembly protein W